MLLKGTVSKREFYDFLGVGGSGCGNIHFITFLVCRNDFLQNSRPSAIPLKLPPMCGC